MKKVRSNARWNELSAEQLATLDKWLFEERLSYTEAWRRAKNELGFKGGETSVKRYYGRRSKERTMMEFTELRKQAVEIMGAPGEVNDYRTASMKLLTAYLFQQVRQAPGEVDKWGPVAHLIVDNDHNEAMRELKGEEHRIRRETLDFARDKFQYDMVERAVRALPQLQRLAEAMSDPDPKRCQDNPHWNEARQIMFEPRADKAQDEEQVIEEKGDTNG